MSRENRHVPDDLLASFVDGNLDEAVACAIAEHLDACVACNNRAVAREPLAAAFAAVDDPRIPADLADVILAEAARPERGPTVEIAIGTALLAVAAVLALAGGVPIGGALAVGRGLDALARVGAHVGPSVGPSLVLLVAISGAAIVAMARAGVSFDTSDGAR